MSKFGIFMGEFNPPTVAHTTVAHYMLHRLNLNKMVFYPTIPASLTTQADIDKHCKMIRVLMWKALSDYRPYASYTDWSHTQGLSLLDNLNELRDNHDRNLQRKRKYSLIGGASQILRVVNDPDWPTIKDEIKVYAMVSDGRGGQQSAYQLHSLQPDYFNDTSGHLVRVPRFENDDALILKLLGQKDYDSQHLQENLDPWVIDEIRKQNFY